MAGKQKSILAGKFRFVMNWFFLHGELTAGTIYLRGICNLPFKWIWAFTENKQTDILT